MLSSMPNVSLWSLGRAYQYVNGYSNTLMTSNIRMCRKYCYHICPGGKRSYIDISAHEGPLQYF